MKTTTQKLCKPKLFGFTLVVLVAQLTSCFAQNSELLAFLSEGYEYNKSSIHSATGKAIVAFERIVKTNDKNILSRFGKGGIERREVLWYLSGDNRRIDERSIDIPEGKRRFGLPITRETAWSPDKRIYFHHFQKFPAEAYINHPWREGFKFVRNVTSYFDPTLFFNVGEYSSLEKIYEKFGSSLKLSTEGTEKGQCYKLYGEREYGDNLKQRIEIEIDPSQGYNVTKMQVYSNLYSEGPIIVLDATYTDGKTNGEFYFPKTYQYRFVGGDVTEIIDVNFSDVVINQPVDDKVFTFEGMGVPPGTKLIDMRYGDHIHSYYKGLPAEQLDILAKEIREDKWIKNQPVTSVNDSNALESGKDSALISPVEFNVPVQDASPPVHNQDKSAGKGAWGFWAIFGCVSITIVLFAGLVGFKHLRG
ncbi:MAG: hypothetical protein GWN00_30075 [Aliifodinibius sp.]|nr:hypothetical protein [Phycisphaerae bacterium]NIT60303.1 hypothetical protein [Fodinibius sp.]NIY28885.1 hypothetical protein [Fodinibius sp.]